VALAAGIKLDLTSLPSDLQRNLVREISRLDRIPTSTIEDVVSEFIALMDQSGQMFPLAMNDALRMVGSTISPEISMSLRKEAGLALYDDPWMQIGQSDSHALLEIVEAERNEIAAILLSKLPVSKSAEILGKISGERARRIAYAISRTEKISPSVVAKIGQSIAEQLDMKPVRAFEISPDNRVGEILNFSVAATRDGVLDGLDEDDAEFAKKVRKSIFTFEHIASRIDAQFIPNLVREFDQAQFVIAMAGATDKNAASRDFILENMSKRMADQTREDMNDLGQVKPDEVEAAMAQIVHRIRELVDTGELKLNDPDEVGNQ
jgi:flagellar motor switch protein FliG